MFWGHVLKKMVSLSKGVLLSLVLIILIGLSGKISLISASDYNVEERAYFYLNRFESSLQNYTDVTTYEQLDSNINKKYQQLEKSLIREIEGLSHLYTDSSVFDRDKDKVDKIWIGGASKLISKFKSKWIAKREVKKVVENRQTPGDIGTKLSGLYDDLLLKFSGMNLSGVEFFNSYRENAGELAENELGEYNQWLNTELETVQNSMADKYSNISIDSINEQMEIEKSSAIYKQKRYISLILNRSIGEKFSEVTMDNRSLRQQMEKAHAEKVSREIENSINKKLSENIRSKLDNILSGAEKEINSESELTSVLKDFYKKGLEIWAVGAGKLVAKENEWFRNYDDIYNEGTDAWTAALTVLQDKKNQWMREYSDIVEQGLNDWESNLNEMYLSKDELINNLDEYIRSKETAFDSYLNNLSIVMETGKDKVAELDGYKEEIGLMIQHVLDPIEGRKLSLEEVRLYNRLINKYKNDEDEFYKYNRDLDTIFDLKTTHIKISKASRRDKLVGNPNYYFMGSVPINNGFSLYVCVENYVKRYKKAFTLKGLLGFYFKVRKEGLEKRYYRIDYHYNNKGEWYKTYSPISENSDRSIKARPNLKEINSSLERYVDLIETLNREKTSLLTSINDTQNSVVEQISSNSDILENQLFTDRAKFEEYFFGDNEVGFIQNDIAKEIYKSYYKKTFWEGQIQIIDNTLSYIFDRSEREDASKTIEDYENAKDSYTSALCSYQSLLKGSFDEEGRLINRGLSQIQEDISNKTDEISESKEELSEKEAELRSAISKLSSLKLAQAERKLLLDSVINQVSSAFAQKYSYLREIFTIGNDDNNQAYENLLKNTISISNDYSNQLNDMFFDPEIKDSYVSVKNYSINFDSIIKEIPKSTENEDFISYEDILAFSERLRGYFNSIPDTYQYGRIKNEIKKLENQITDYLKEGQDSQQTDLVNREDFYRSIASYIYSIKKLYKIKINSFKNAYSAIFTGSINPDRYSFGLRKDRFSSTANDIKNDIKEQSGYLDKLKAEDMDNFFVWLCEELGIDTELIDKSMADEVTPDELLSKINSYISIFTTEKLNKIKIDFSKDDWNEKSEDLFKELSYIKSFSNILNSTALEILVNKREISLERGDDEDPLINLDDYRENLVLNIDEELGNLGVSLNILDEALERVEGQSYSDDQEKPPLDFDTYLLEIRDRDVNSFMVIKDIYTKSLEDDLLSSYRYKDSQMASEKYNIYENFYSKHDFSIPGISEHIFSDVSEAKEVARDIFNTDEMKVVNDRIRNGYFDREAKDVTPIDGSIDNVLIPIVLHLKDFKNNSFLAGRYEVIKNTLGKYVASNILFKNQSKFYNSLEGELDDSSINDEINNGIMDFFKAIVVRAKELGYNEKEVKEIEDNLTLALLYNEDTNNFSNSLDNYTSAERSQFTIAIEEVLKSLQYYRDEDGYNSAGAAGYLINSGLSGLLPFEKTLDESFKNDYVRKNYQYSKLLRSFNGFPTIKTLTSILNSDYIAGLSIKDIVKAKAISENLMYKYVLSHFQGAIFDYNKVYSMIDNNFGFSLDVLNNGNLKNNMPEIIRNLKYRLMFDEGEMWNEFGHKIEDKGKVIFSDRAEKYGRAVEDFKTIYDFSVYHKEIYNNFSDFVERVNDYKASSMDDFRFINYLRNNYIRMGFFEREKYLSIPYVDEGCPFEALDNLDIEIDNFNRDFIKWSLMYDKKGIDVKNLTDFIKYNGEYALIDPLPDLISNLVENLRVNLNKLIFAENIGLRDEIEFEINGFIKNKSKDFRRGLYEAREIFEQNFGDENPEILSSVNSIAFIDDSSYKDTGSKIYLEGFGKFTGEGESTDEIPVATLFISNNHGFNIFVNNQNRLIQSLYTLFPVLSIDEEDLSKKLNDDLVIYKDNGDGAALPESMDVFSRDSSDRLNILPIDEESNKQEVDERIDILISITNGLSREDYKGQTAFLCLWMLLVMGGN